MTLSRRDVLKRGSALGAGVAAGLSVAGTTLASGAHPGGFLTARRQDAKKYKVIFVVHDLNPFFAPAKVGFEHFGELAGWDTQFLGPPVGDVPATVNLQEQAIAAQPDAVGFTRIDTSSFDETIKRAQEAGIFVILFNTASDGYKDLGLAYIGQDFIPAGIKNGYQAALYAQQITGKTDGEIVLGTIQPGHSALEARMEGTRQGIAQYNQEKGTTFAASDPLKTSTDQTQAVAALEAKYTADGDKIVGWAFADYVHWFCALWSQDRGLVGKFSNGGFDLLDGVTTAIKDGSANWSIGQNPYGQGWVTSALIQQKLEAGFDANDYNSGAELVDKSNIDVVIAREALYKDVKLS
jgi:ribose transport system substrate-binding protein